MRKRRAVFEEAEQLTGAMPGDLTRFLASGAVEIAMLALGVDVTAGSRASIKSLRAERTSP
jgi:hypothetical protein